MEKLRNPFKKMQPVDLEKLAQKIESFGDQEITPEIALVVIMGIGLLAQMRIGIQARESIPPTNPQNITTFVLASLSTAIAAASFNNKAIASAKNQDFKISTHVLPAAADGLRTLGNITQKKIT